MNFSPEYRLLRACLSSARSVAGPTYIDDFVADGIDWSRARELAEWHQLVPLLYELLSVYPPGRVPQDVMDDLALTTHRHTARTVHMLARLRSIVAALSAAEVPVVMLKGAALVDVGAYPSPALRPMGDLDLLVHPHDLETAEAIIVDLGFSISAGQSRDAQARMRVQHRHLPMLLSDDGVVGVELHRHIVGAEESFAFDIERLWLRARPSADGSCLVPGWEDLVLHLGVHFTCDRKWQSNSALRQIADIVHCVQAAGESLDWDLLAIEAREGYFATKLFFALFAVTRLVGEAIVPDDALAALRPDGYSSDLGNHFLARRVLSAERRLPLEFLTRRKRPLRRLFPERSVAIERHRLDPAVGLQLHFYTRRVATAVRRVARELVRPRLSLQELRLNRLLRSG